MRSQNTLAAVLVVIGIMLIVGGLIVGSYTPPTCTDSSCLGPAWQPHAPLGAAMAIIGAIFVVVGALIAIVRAVSLAGTRSDHLATSQASVADVMAALPPLVAGPDERDNPLA